MILTMLYMACTGSNYSCDNPNVDCTGGGTNSSDSFESDSNTNTPTNPEENDCGPDEIPNCDGDGCSPADWITDDYCDEELNCEQYDFDGGDCDSDSPSDTNGNMWTDGAYGIGGYIIEDDCGFESMPTDWLVDSYGAEADVEVAWSQFEFSIIHEYCELDEDGEFMCTGTIENDYYQYVSELDGQLGESGGSCRMELNIYSASGEFVCVSAFQISLEY